jgi:hypothetical protein
MPLALVKHALIAIDFIANPSLIHMDDIAVHRGEQGQHAVLGTKGNAACAHALLQDLEYAYEARGILDSKIPHLFLKPP